MHIALIPSRDSTKPEFVDADDRLQKMREEFEKLVEAGKAGHRGDIVPRPSDFEIEPLPNRDFKVKPLYR